MYCNYCHENIIGPTTVRTHLRSGGSAHVACLKARDEELRRTAANPANNNETRRKCIDNANRLLWHFGPEWDVPEREA